MAVQGIGGGGSPSALYALRLAFRQVQPGGVAAAEGAPAPAALTPDGVMQDIVARAQFMASLRAASAAVEQVGTLLETFDGGGGRDGAPA